ncbi:hypothetical protein BH18ACI4_BH18ACI4_23920 [soil metagenome]
MPSGFGRGVLGCLKLETGRRWHNPEIQRRISAEDIQVVLTRQKQLFLRSGPRVNKKVLRETLERKDIRWPK